MIEKTFIDQGLRKLELDDYLKKQLDRAGFTKSEIVKTPLVTRIVVNVTRPGLAIGKSGSNITQLTQDIEKKFGIDNPQLEIKEIENPAINAQAVANKIKALIERGFSWRSIVFKTVRDITENGAQGLEILLSGKLAGKGGRKRKQRISQGYMKKVGEQAKLVDYGTSAAYPKVGAIGIKVRIVRPETSFPDKADVKEAIKAREAAVEETPPEKEGEKEAEVSEKEETTEDKKEEVKTEDKKAEEPKKEEKPESAEKKEESKEATKKEEKKEAETPEKKETKEKTKEEVKEEKKESEKKDENKEKAGEK